MAISPAVKSGTRRGVEPRGANLATRPHLSTRCRRSRCRSRRPRGQAQRTTRASERSRSADNARTIRSRLCRRLSRDGRGAAAKRSVVRNLECPRGRDARDLDAQREPATRRAESLLSDRWV